jgi:hypothetical protein
MLAAAAERVGFRLPIMKASRFHACSANGAKGAAETSEVHGSRREMPLVGRCNRVDRRIDLSSPWLQPCRILV